MGKNKAPKTVDPALLALLLLNANRFLFTTGTCSTGLTTADRANQEDEDLDLLMLDEKQTMAMDDQRLRLLEFQTDLELAERTSDNHKIIQQVLVEIGNVLSDAEHQLYQLDETKLGQAMIRLFQESADHIAKLAESLEAESDPQLVEASLQDFSGSNSLTLSPKQADGHDFDAIFKNLAVFLRDVESALRSMSESEAEELASAALTVGQMAVYSLKNIHRQLTPEQILDAMNNDRYTRTIESGQDGHAPRLTSSRGMIEASHEPKRMRCLWPALGPIVVEKIEWTKEELYHQPWYVAAGLGVTMWPMVVGTAMVGAPALVCDHILQSTYSHFSESEPIKVLEMLFAEAIETAKLGILTTKALAKPAITVATLQTKRHLPGLVDTAKEKITHPIATVQETAKGALWIGGHVVNFVQQQIQKHQNNQELLVQ